MVIPECEHDYDDTGYCLKCRNIDMSKAGKKEIKAGKVDISQYTVIETKGWTHNLSNKLFDTKEEADHNWAVNIFSKFVSVCTTYESFDEEMFIAKVGQSEELRIALGILSKPLITPTR